MLSVFVSNLSEDVWDFIQGISNPKDRQVEITENAYLGDRAIYTCLAYKDCLLITPLAIDLSFVEYFQKVTGKKDLRVAAPSKHTGQTCLDIVQDQVLFSQLVSEGKAKAGIALYSYSSSPQLYTLCDKLKSAGVSVSMPESPLPQNAWTVSFLGSKQGIKQTTSYLSPDTSLFAVPGFVFDDPHQVMSFLQNNHLEGAPKHRFVVKINRGHAGMGLIMPDSKPDGADKAQKAFAKDRYWNEGKIVVEKFITEDRAVGGGSPDVELVVLENGQVKYLFGGGMRVNDAGVFNGMEVGKGSVPEKILTTMKNFGLKLGQLYSDMGYRGYFDIDFIADTNGGLHITESNVRKTGATHAYILARHLLGEGFEKNHIFLVDSSYQLPKGVKPTLSQILTVLEPVLWSAKTKSGVVIIHEKLLKLNRLSYVVFGPNKAAAEAIEAKMFALLQAA